MHCIKSKTFKNKFLSSFSVKPLYFLFSSSRNFKPEASPPATLDDELLREKTVLTKKRSLVDRYERQDINVMCMHSKGKTIK